MGHPGSGSPRCQPPTPRLDIILTCQIELLCKLAHMRNDMLADQPHIFASLILAGVPLNIHKNEMSGPGYPQDRLDPLFDMFGRTGNDLIVVTHFLKSCIDF